MARKATSIHKSVRLRSSSINGKIDYSMDEIDRANPRLKGALNKNYSSPVLDTVQCKSPLFTREGSAQLGVKDGKKGSSRNKTIQPPAAI